MVFKINEFDYLNANLASYQQFASFFYKYMSQKYHLDITTSFINIQDNYNGLTTTACTYDIHFRPALFHMVSLDINKLFKEIPNDQIRFFEFLSTLYHELYHILVIERANKENCFDLTSLLSAIQNNDQYDKNFWSKNYSIVDEEIKAYIYGIKKAAKYMQKNYADYNHYGKIDINRYLMRGHFYHNYYYGNEKISKNTTIIKMLNNFKSTKDKPYPIILEKVYNFKTNQPKNIDELINDFECYYHQYQRNLKQQQKIKTFYATIISEKYFSKKNLNKIPYFLKINLNEKKKVLQDLKLIHPITINKWLEQQTYIKEQTSDIINQQTTINNLKTIPFG